MAKKEPRRYIVWAAFEVDASNRGHAKKIVERIVRPDNQERIDYYEARNVVIRIFTSPDLDELLLGEEAASIPSGKSVLLGIGQA